METIATKPDTETPGAIPLVMLSPGLLPAMGHYLAGFAKCRGHQIETGGMLAGEFIHARGAPLFRIREFIGAGPKAECLEDSVLFDQDYQVRRLALLRRGQSQIGNIGCIHFHPDGADECSEGDWRADVAAVRASDTRSLIFGIITRPRRGSNNTPALYHRGFKFDFFVLSEAAGFNYKRVQPVIEESLMIHATNPDPRPGALRSHFRKIGPALKLLKDKRRLVAEVRAMEERYGSRASLRLDQNCLYWEYVVEESGRRFPIHVIYPPDYPLWPPRIFSILPLPLSPHQLPHYELCWTNRSNHCEWNPGRDTAATTVLAAHRWFACLLVYLTLGRWPEGADHQVQEFS